MSMTIVEPYGPHLVLHSIYDNNNYTGSTSRRFCKHIVKLNSEDSFAAQVKAQSDMKAIIALN